MFLLLEHCVCPSNARWLDSMTSFSLPLIPLRCFLLIDFSLFLLNTSFPLFHALSPQDLNVLTHHLTFSPFALFLLSLFHLPCDWTTGSYDCRHHKSVWWKRIDEEENIPNDCHLKKCDQRPADSSVSQSISYPWWSTILPSDRCLWWVLFFYPFIQSKVCVTCSLREEQNTRRRIKRLVRVLHVDPFLFSFALFLLLRTLVLCSILSTGTIIHSHEVHVRVFSSLFHHMHTYTQQIRMIGNSVTLCQFPV